MMFVLFVLDMIF